MKDPKKGQIVKVKNFRRIGFVRGDQFLSWTAPRVPCHREAFPIPNQREETQYIVIGFSYIYEGDYHPGTNEDPGQTRNPKKVKLISLTPFGTQRFQLFKALEEDLIQVTGQLSFLEV